MRAIPLALVLAAAMLHAGWNVVLHGKQDRLATVTAGGILGGLLLLPAVILAPPFRVWPLAALSGVAEAAYFIFLSSAYRRGELSLTYPIARGTAPLIATLAAAPLLGQSLTPLRLAGAGSLGLGLATIARTGRQRGRLPAVGFAVLTGVSIAAYSTIDAGAVREVSPFGYLGLVTAVEVLALLLWLRFDLHRVWRAARPGAGVGLGSVGAYVLVLMAFQRAPIAPVTTIRELSVLIGILLAREQTGPRVLAGAALCVAGAAMVVR
ncbi:MAG: EamA family transporter [Actinobacteria bacterium]|nr:EamA family transporter [Actinomycetota bacterium]